MYYYDIYYLYQEPIFLWVQMNFLWAISIANEMLHRLKRKIFIAILFLLFYRITFDSKENNPVFFLQLIFSIPDLFSGL